MVAFGVLTPDQVYRDAVSWDTIVLFLGMMILSSLRPRAVLSLGSVYIVLRIAFRRELRKARPLEPHVAEPPLHRGHALLCFFALLFVVAGFFAGYSLAWTAMLGAALLLILTRGDPREIF